MKTYEVTLERVFSAPRHLVWGLLADTNRWDRASGLKPGDYEWRLDQHSVRRRHGKAQELGFDIEWVEPAYEWIEGRMVSGERRFLKGPVAAGGFRAEVQDEGATGTRATATAYVRGEGMLARPVGVVMQQKFRKHLTAYLDAIEGTLGTTPSIPPGRPSFAGAMSVLRGSENATLSGVASPAHEDALYVGARRLEQEPVDMVIGAKIIDHLRSRPDEEVAQVRAFEVADDWGMDRREVLHTFLHATRAGLTDLRWQINCPVCRVSASVVTSLAHVGKDIHCDACNIRYDVDFGKHVEAVFQCNPAIRQVQAGVFCASSPAFSPHIFAQLAVEPGKTRELEMDVPAGGILVRVLEQPIHARTRLDQAPDTLGIWVDDKVSIEVGTDTAQSTRVRVDCDRPGTIVFERTDWTAGAVLGTDIMTFPAFLDLFATDAPASGAELSIGRIALLFSDLTGSTALYEESGDARAFSIVQEHFTSMTRIVVDHGGAVVKTMGDAVMASFSSEEAAVKAALEMARDNHRQHGDLGLGLKLGVHSGPCLVVRANDRVDFFGTTVNVAARLQAQAKGGQLVIASALVDHPGVKVLLDGLHPTHFAASLKGIAADQQLSAYQIV